MKKNFGLKNIIKAEKKSFKSKEKGKLEKR